MLWHLLTCHQKVVGEHMNLLQAAQQQIQTAIQAANSSCDGGSSSVAQQQQQQQQQDLEPAAVNVSKCTDASKFINMQASPL